MKKSLRRGYSSAKNSHAGKHSQAQGPVKKHPISPGETAQNSHAEKGRTLPLFAEARLQICSLPSSARRPADLIRIFLNLRIGYGMMTLRGCLFGILRACATFSLPARRADRAPKKRSEKNFHGLAPRLPRAS